MSDNELTMDEKYFDLQNRLIETKLSAIASAVENFGKDIKKVLDDHELRLREQAKSSTINAQEIIALSAVNAQKLVVMENGQKELKCSIIALEAEAMKRLDALAKEREENSRKELTLWQTIAIEAIKFTFLGAGGGGVIIAIVKLFGITL
jgi:hypothetical protein